MRVIAPRDRRLGGEQVIGECFDCFADFQQAGADGVEDQPVDQPGARRWRPHTFSLIPAGTCGDGGIDAAADERDDDVRR